MPRMRKEQYWKECFWYVLVYWTKGKFIKKPTIRAVTYYQGSTIYWKEGEKPKAMTEYIAKECATRLIVNDVRAFPICIPYELVTQNQVEPFVR